MPHLLAVRPAIAAVPAPGQRVAFSQPLEVRRRHVVQQQVVVDLEQLPEPGSDVPLHGILVRQDLVQRPVQSLLVDLVHRHPEQVVQRRLAVPVLRDMQLARRLREPGQHQDRRHRRPRHLLPTGLDQLLEQHVKPQRPPQQPSQPDIAKLPRTLEPYPPQLDRHRLGRLLLRIEQARHRGTRSADVLGQGARLRPSRSVQLAQCRHRLLPHTPTHAHAAHQTPVHVRLAVLAHRRMTQVHALPSPILCTARERRIKRVGWHYTRFPKTAC